MNILMISLDEKILEKDSSSQRRHFEYGKICDNFDILVLYNGETYEKDNVKIYPVKGKNKIIRLLNAYKKAKFIIKNHKIDVITTQDVSYTGLLGYLLKKKYGVSLNVQIHGLEEKFLNKLLFWGIRGKIIKNANSIRVVSERIKKYILKKYKIDEAKIFKIPIFIDTERIKQANIFTRLKDKYPQFDFIIITISRLVKIKNIELQINALKYVVKIYNKAGLIIIGNGPEKEKLELRVKELALEDNIKFEGWQDNLISYYKTADLMLLTSNYEGWGLVVIESMAAKCPVIMTDVGCAGEIVKNEENGIIIPGGDKKALIAAVCGMISDREKRLRIAKNGMETISKLPNKEQTLEMYKKMWAF